MAAVRVTTVSLPSAAFAFGPALRLSDRRPLRAAVSAFCSGRNNSPPASPFRQQLVLYTKPGCCLCEGLKEKLHAALSLGGSHSLHSVRDISGNAEWERMYQYEIPVLTKVLPDGSEEKEESKYEEEEEEEEEEEVQEEEKEEEEEEEEKEVKVEKDEGEEEEEEKKEDEAEEEDEKKRRRKKK
ncbi:hypothetical protein KSP40_PGU022468 [Platanthera guangdongensis]|uniref:Glutaredoxin-like protein n=1 Tax=Platanthera guangdongensis TaxID=2320717 RepID=A0ABR2LJN0_9ASPA